MTFLVLILLVNAVLHGIIVGRFGIKGNAPPAVFGALYAALAFTNYCNLSYGIHITLVVTTIGLVGLALNYKKLQHDTTVEKIIFFVGTVILITAGYMLLIR